MDRNCISWYFFYIVFLRVESNKLLNFSNKLRCATNADLELFLYFFQRLCAFENGFFNIFVGNIEPRINYARAFNYNSTILSGFTEVVVGGLLERFIRKHRTMDFPIWKSS